MRKLFTNNSAGLLASELADDALTATLMTGAGAVFSEPQAGEIQLLTLGSGAGPFEIVRLTERTGDVLTIERAQEATANQVWPVGTQVSARITAGILDSLLQVGAAAPDATSLALHPGAQAWGAGATAIGDGVIAEVDNGWKIRGLPVIPHDRDLFSMGLMGNGGALAVVTTPLVDLGVPRVWEATTYLADGDIVQPTTPNGFQYRVIALDLLVSGAPAGGTQTDAIEPTFGATVGDFTESTSGTHKFLCMNPSAGFTMGIAGNFFPSEVGFICCTNDRDTITLKPSISIGADGVEGSLMATTQLTQITSDFGAQVHSLAGTWNVGAQSLHFKLETKAIGGRYVGRFYAKGMLIHNLIV